MQENIPVTHLLDNRDIFIGCRTLCFCLLSCFNPRTIDLSLALSHRSTNPDIVFLIFLKTFYRSRLHRCFLNGNLLCLFEILIQRILNFITGSTCRFFPRKFQCLFQSLCLKCCYFFKGCLCAVRCRIPIVRCRFQCCSRHL